mmetsp:Transcript_13334/g.26355  ORF Transcript_13334/g.26355 Transcript_13334/m.26355 type:complete len:145 (-) Transcript_13334:714-1148(-)
MGPSLLPSFLLHVLSFLPSFFQCLPRALIFWLSFQSVFLSFPFLCFHGGRFLPVKTIPPPFPFELLASPCQSSLPFFSSRQVAFTNPPPPFTKKDKEQMDIKTQAADAKREAGFQIKGSLPPSLNPSAPFPVSKCPQPLLSRVS